MSVVKRYDDGAISAVRHWQLGRLQLGFRFWRHTSPGGPDRLVLYPTFVFDRKRTSSYRDPDSCTCTSCGVPTLDDPHFTDDGQVWCDEHCPACALLSGGGSDASLPRGVPAVGDPVLPGARTQVSGGEIPGSTAATPSATGHPAAERETAPAVER